MKIATRVVVQMTKNIGEYLPVEKCEYEYEGQVALCDRAASSNAKNLVGQDKQAAAEAGGEAATEHGQLAPFYQNEMDAEHLFTPGQNAELLTAAEAPLGSVMGDAQHQAELAGARTRNASGFTKTLQDVAREKMKGAAGASEGIAAQDILGAKDLNQRGAAGEMGLFGADTSKQLQSLGLEDKAIGTEIEAGKSGWLQNLNATISAITGGKGLKMGGGGS